jgi:hypothetical protein
LAECRAAPVLATGDLTGRYDGTLEQKIRLSMAFRRCIVYSDRRVRTYGAPGGVVWAQLSLPPNNNSTLLSFILFLSVYYQCHDTTRSWLELSGSAGL